MWRAYGESVPALGHPERARMAEDGFAVWPGAVAVPESAEAEARELGLYIDGPDAAVFGVDAKRKTISDLAALLAHNPGRFPGLQRTILRAERRFRQLGLINAHRRVQQWRLIGSSQACLRQPDHCDFRPEDVVGQPDDAKPLVAIVAVMPGSTLDVAPGTHNGNYAAFRRRRVRAPLDAGDALVFCGDLVHAGSAYTDGNFRLHCDIAASKAMTRILALGDGHDVTPTPAGFGDCLTDRPPPMPLPPLPMEDEPELPTAAVTSARGRRLNPEGATGRPFRLDRHVGYGSGGV